MSKLGVLSAIIIGFVLLDCANAYVSYCYTSSYPGDPFGVTKRCRTATNYCLKTVYSANKATYYKGCDDLSYIQSYVCRSSGGPVSLIITPFGGSPISTFLYCCNGMNCNDATSMIKKSILAPVVTALLAIFAIYH